MRLLLCVSLLALVGCNTGPAGVPFAPSQLVPPSLVPPVVPGGRGTVTPQHQSTRKEDIYGNPQCDVPETNRCKVLWLMSESWARQRTIVRIEILRLGAWIPFDVIGMQVGEVEKDWFPRDDQRGQYRWFAARLDPTSADGAAGFFSF